MITRFIYTENWFIGYEKIKDGTEVDVYLLTPKLHSKVFAYVKIVSLHLAQVCKLVPKTSSSYKLERNGGHGRSRPCGIRRQPLPLPRHPGIKPIRSKPE